LDIPRIPVRFDDGSEWPQPISSYRVTEIRGGVPAAVEFLRYRVQPTEPGAWDTIAGLRADFEGAVPPALSERYSLSLVSMTAAPFTDASAAKQSLAPHVFAIAQGAFNDPARVEIVPLAGE
jgi:hypothetical protein